MKQQVGGFSLYELVAVLIIVGIALTAGLPIVYQQIMKQNVDTTFMQLRAAIRVAQEEALRRGSSKIIICPANYNVNEMLQGDWCGATNGDWSEGILNFIDLNNNGDYNGSSSNERMTAIRFDNEVTITVTSNGSNVNKFILNSSGQITDANSNSSWIFTFNQSKFGSSYCRSSTMNQFGSFTELAGC